MRNPYHQIHNGNCYALAKTAFSFTLKILLLSGVPLIVRSQAPVITYGSGNKVFYIGKTIANTTPYNTGGAVPSTSSASVSTFAGNRGYEGYVDATGTNARFNEV